MRPKEVPRSLQFHKAGWEEIAKPPMTFHFIIVLMSMNCLHNKNANGGGEGGEGGITCRMEIGNDQKKLRCSPLGRGWGGRY